MATSNTNLKNLTLKELAFLWALDKNKIDKTYKAKEKAVKPSEPKKEIKTFDQYLDSKWLEDPIRFRSYAYKYSPYKITWIVFSSLLLLTSIIVTIFSSCNKGSLSIFGCICSFFSFLFLIHTIKKRKDYVKGLEKETIENDKLKEESNLWHLKIEKEYKEYFRIATNNYNNAIKCYKEAITQYNSNISKLDNDYSFLSAEVVTIEEIVFKRCINIMKKYSKSFTKIDIESVENVELIWSDMFLPYVKEQNSKIQDDVKILKNYFIDQAKREAEREARRIAREEAEEQRRIRNAELKMLKNLEKNDSYKFKKDSNSTYSIWLDKNKEKERIREEERKQKLEAERQANIQAAIIRCAQCHLYRTCCSYKKNKDPNCTAFRYRENFK